MGLIDEPEAVATVPRGLVVLTPLIGTKPSVLMLFADGYVATRLKVPTGGLTKYHREFSNTEDEPLVLDRVMATLLNVMPEGTLVLGD